jgi:hypothetical protein
VDPGTAVAIFNAEIDGNIPAIGQSLPLVYVNLGEIERINQEFLLRQPNAVTSFAICHAQHPITGLPKMSLPAKVVIGLGSKQISVPLETSVPGLRCIGKWLDGHSVGLLAMANCRQSVDKAPNHGITLRSVTCLDQCTLIVQGINGTDGIRFPGRQEPWVLSDSTSISGC